MLRIGVLSSCFSPQAFTGSGNRLDGKKKGIEPSPAPLDPSDIKRYQPQSDPDHFTLTAKLYVLIFAVFLIHTEEFLTTSSKSERSPSSETPDNSHADLTL